MIQQITDSIEEKVKHSANLKTMVNSLFSFGQELSLEDLKTIDVATITAVNYDKIIETVEHAVSVVKSEVVGIDPPTLRDTLFLIRLAMDQVQYQLILVNVNLKREQEMLDAQPAWRRHIKWTRAYRSYSRHQHWTTEQQDMQGLWNRLSTTYTEFRRTIRQVTLSIVKAHVPPAEKHYITDVETLEAARTILLRLLNEIETQLRWHAQNRRVVYYEADRIRIFNKLQSVGQVMGTLTFQLSKLHLESAILTPDLIESLKFKEKKGFRWYVSDKRIFRLLTQREVPLRSLIESLDRLLQPESHKLNLRANNVAYLGELLRYAAATTATSETKPPATAKPQKRTTPERSSVTPIPLRTKNKLKKRPEVAPLELTEEEESEENILTLGLEEVEETEGRPQRDRGVGG